MKQHAIAMLPVLALSLTACKEQSTPSAAASPPSAADLAVFDRFFAASPPASPGEIHTVRTTAKPGDTITVKGLVMGREKPFVEGRAAFVLGDRTLLTPCNDKPGDNCTTPWDTCCDKEAIPQATATIQLVDADGRVLKQGLKGVHGLTELSAVTLTGTVDKASTPEALIINASQLHVATATPAK
jgi:hypothetical protein